MIVSARHGLLHPDTVIDPYEQTLPSRGTSPQLLELLTTQCNSLPCGPLIVLASARYVDALAGAYPNRVLVTPLKHLAAAGRNPRPKP